MQNLFQGPAFKNLDYRVNMIRHNAPGNQPVSLTIMKQYCFLHHGRNGLPGKPAGAVSCIFIFVNPDPESDVSRMICGQFIVPAQLEFPLGNHFFGNGIGEAEGNRLDNVGLVKMRDIPSGVPG